MRFSMRDGKVLAFSRAHEDRLGLYLGNSTKKIGIDRSVTVTDTLTSAVEFPILRIITTDIR